MTPPVRPRGISLPVFPRLPAWFTHMGYGCLLDFAVLCQLIRHVRLISGFCSSGYDFAIPSSRLYLTIQALGVALGFVGNYAPCGLSPQTNGMPAILQKKRTLSDSLFELVARGGFEPSTLRVWTVCSSQLSYLAILCYSVISVKVGPTGLEPVTLCL